MNPSENKFAKILFVSSYAPPAIGGAQLVMYNLISHLPVETYCMLTSFYHIDNFTAQTGNWLPGEYIFYDKPQAPKNTEGTVSTRGRNIMFRLKDALRKSFWVQLFLGIPVVVVQIFKIVRVGHRAIQQKNIEVITGFSDYGAAILGSYILHRQSKLPLNLVVFDLYRGNNFFFLGGKLLARIMEPIILESASQIMVTNNGVKDLYRKRYGDKVADKITVIYNSTSPDKYLSLVTPYQPKPPYTILFTGSIYWPQINSLKNLIKAVDQINDLDIVVKLYTPHNHQYVKSLGINSPKIILDRATPDEMPKIQSQADILFLPLSWRTTSPDIINTATPGKLTEYLIAGRPILIHAPAESTLVQYAKEDDFALVVDQENIDELAKAIRQLLSNQELANRLVHNAQTTFMKNHDISKTVEKFKALFVK